MYRYLFFATTALCSLMPVAAGADEDAARIDELSRQVDALSAAVAQLRASVELLDSIRPTTTTLMPSIAERFHVMHYAGEAEDWALAAHELLGIERLFEIISRVSIRREAPSRTAFSRRN